MGTKLAEKPLRQVATVQELLVNDMARGQLAAVAAEHMRPERMMRLMANAIRTTPKLGDCEPLTLLGALMTCASLGLEPNTILGHAYLIPFENRRKGVTEVQLVLGYKGMIDLARRSGVVVNIHADVVYENDDFSFEYGTNQHLTHRPGPSRDKPIYAYCHAKLTDGEAFIVLPYAEVLKIRNSSQGYQTAIKYGKKDSPWMAHEHQMARKTAVRALFNELPISIEKVSDALQIDDRSTDYSAFAMDPTAGMPDADGDMIDGTAEEADEQDQQEDDEAPEQQEKAKPEPAKKTQQRKEPEPKREAEKPAPKKEEEKAKEPEPEQDAPDDDEGDDGQSNAPTDDDMYAKIVEVVKEELEAAQDVESVDSVLDMYADQIEPLNGSQAYDDIHAAADKARERLA